MKNYNISSLGCIAFVNLVLIGSVYSQDTKCKIEIQFPTAGDKVGPNGQIRGTASVPAGMHVWVFAQKDGQQVWWPQGGGEAPVKTESWKREATYGTPSDVSGSEFRITAVVVNQDQHNALKNYVKETMGTGQYPGTDLPSAPSGGCSVDKDVVVVKK